MKTYLHNHPNILLHIHWTIPHANNEAWNETGDGTAVPDFGIYENGAALAFGGRYQRCCATAGYSVCAPSTWARTDNGYFFTR